MRVALALAALVLASCGARRPKAPDRRLRVETRGEMFAISNGYTVVVLEDSTSKLARVDVRYPAGSADDPPGKEGLAHLAEHLLYEFDVAGPTGSTTSLYSEFGRVSSTFNASTSADYVHFESQGLPDALPELLRLEALRMQTTCDKIRPEVFAREKEVVLNELRERLGADGGDLRSDVHAALYGDGHPYRSVDSVASVSSLTQEDVCRFIADPMRRGRATLIVSGNVTSQRVRAIVDETFARVPSRIVDENPRPAPATHEYREVTIQADVAEPSVIFAWALPPEGTREYRFLQEARSQMASTLGWFASKYSWGHSAHTWIAGGGDAPYLMLQVTLRSMGGVSDAKEAAGKTLANTHRSLARGGDTQKSYTWQRRMVEWERRLLMQYESLGTRAHMYAGYLMYDPEVSLLVEKLKELRTSTPQEVRKLAEEWLQMKRAKVLVIEPRKGTKKLSLASAYGGSHSVGSGIAVDPKEADSPIELPADGASLEIETTRYTMPNGLEVVFWNQGSMPVLHGRLITHSGSAADPSGREGTALVSGFDRVLEDSMTYWNNEVATMVDELLYDILYELRSPGRSVSKKLRDHLKSRLKLRGSEPRRVFAQRMRNALYGEEHPYARPAMTKSSIDKLTRDRVLGWARKNIVPKNSTLVLTGNFDETEARNWIRFFVDQTDAGSRAKPVSEVPQPSGGAFIAGESPDASPTVDIDIRFPGAAGIGLDFGARQVLASVLASKLAGLRQDHAITYGMTAHWVPQAAGGFWQIRGDVDAARAEEAGALIRQVLEEVRSGSESWKTEFVLARKKRVDGLLASASDSGAIADRLEVIARFGLTDDFFQILVKHTAKLTPSAVSALIQAELGAGQQITGAYGAAAPVAAALKGLRGS